MNNHQAKKRIVDIYFVLYLAALIFLLPGPQKKNDNSRNANLPVPEQSLMLYPEKTTLICTVLPSDSGLKIVSLDSVNTIYYTGLVKDINFEFIVEDQSIGRKVVLNDTRESPTKFFQIEKKLAEHSASFKWQPPLNELANKTYIVTVVASAQVPVSSGNEAAQAAAYENIKVKTQFSLNLMFLSRAELIAQTQNDSLFQSGSNIGAQVDNRVIQPGTVVDMSRDVELFTNSPNVESIAYERWSKQIYLNGSFERDVKPGSVKLRLTRNPDNNGGSGEIIEYKNSLILLSGRTPYAGNMRIEVSALRKLDGKRISVEFAVIPKALSQPDFQSQMYPGMNYVIKTNLPVIIGQETKAVLKDGSKERAVSPEGADFSFTPDISDTGKVLTLERYINNSLRDKFNIQIKGYPDPEITRFGLEGYKKVRVETRSYGMIGGRENLIKYLEIIEGNAKYYQKFGSADKSQGGLAHTQYFEIVPRSNDEAFRFKFRAVDYFGRKSSIQSFSE